jgi:hypothetical protein
MGELRGKSARAVRLQPKTGRRSVPGDQTSLAPWRKVYVCPRCRGSGCDTCGGTGVVTRLRRIAR